MREFPRLNTCNSGVSADEKMNLYSVETACYGQYSGVTIIAASFSDMNCAVQVLLIDVPHVLISVRVDEKNVVKCSNFGVTANRWISNVRISALEHM